MFVKMSDGTFIPFIESGDNNVWDPMRNRRSRDWESCRWIFESEEQRDRISLSEQEIMDSAQKELDLNGKDCIKLSGYSDWGTPAQFLAFFRSGFRHAVTFDDLHRDSCFVTLGWWKEGDYSADYATTEEELLRKWNECLDKGFRPYVGLGVYSERVWDNMKRRTHKERVRTSLDAGRFVITFNYYGSERYARRLTSRNLHITEYRDCAHRYSTEKSARASAEKISRRFSRTITDVRVEEFVLAKNN